MSYVEKNDQENMPPVRCECAGPEECEHGDWSKWAALAEDEIENDEPVDPDVEKGMRENAAG